MKTITKYYVANWVRMEKGKPSYIECPNAKPITWASKSLGRSTPRLSSNFQDSLYSFLFHQIRLCYKTSAFVNICNRTLLTFDNTWSTNKRCISEATTGLWLGGEELPTIKGCVESTKAKLNEVGKERLIMCINQSPKSPFSEEILIP